MQDTFEMLDGAGFTLQAKPFSVGFRAEHLQRRIRDLEPLHRQTRQLAELTARYYDRGYRKNAYYTL